MTGNSSSRATLHILNKAPEHPRHVACLHALAPADTLVLIENGVLSAAGTQLSLPCQLYALKADIEARALESAVGDIETIDYSELVQLTEKHEKIISW
ncbi:sulfurtransferase complex subunit TusB [Marinobacter sp.]|uniref:sulfurtransferase complex subunit TusB n=1 Tax=Marinobacter sp. TaxID=50741 RepID=UPI002B27489C|nr:sulfurtransferase complex subunit TusB [Marinobacter sp.]